MDFSFADSAQTGSRFFRSSDPRADTFVFPLRREWWSRPYEYEWARAFARRGDVALDAASGVCHPLKFFLAESCREVHACDLDERILSREARRREIRDELGEEAAAAFEGRSEENIRYARASVTSLPYEDKVFDRIYCISVLEHLPDACNANPGLCKTPADLEGRRRSGTRTDIYLAMAEFKRTLRDDGLIVLTFDFPSINLDYFARVLEALDLEFAGEVAFDRPQDAVYSPSDGLSCYRALVRKKKVYTPRITLAMIVKNEAKRYLPRVLESARRFIDSAVIVDDGSTDGTPQLCRDLLEGVPLTVHVNDDSKFHNEVVLRKQLWQLALTTGPDWILVLDADEIFEERAATELKKVLRTPDLWHLSFRLYDFWDDSRYREDGWWQAHRIYRPFMVRYDPAFTYRWKETPQHCGRLPANIGERRGGTSDLRVKHFGWATQEDRLFKYRRYQSLDPGARYGIAAQYESILDPHPNLVKWEENPREKRALDFSRNLSMTLNNVRRVVPLKNSFGVVFPVLQDDLMAQVLQIAPEEKVLDVGGGSNPFKRAEVVTEPYLDSSAHRSGLSIRPDVTYVKCFAEKLPFPDRSFDVVMARQILEHTVSPGAACRELMRVGRRGFIETPQKLFELLFGPNPTHNWLVSVIGGKVVFERRRFARHPLRHLGLSAVPSSQEGQVLIHTEFKNLTNVQHYWEEGFEYDVIDFAGGFNYADPLHASVAHLDAAICGLLHGGFFLPQRESDAREAVKLRPDWALAHNTLGAILWLEKRFQEAHASFGRACELERREEFLRNYELDDPSLKPAVADFDGDLPMDVEFCRSYLKGAEFDMVRFLYYDPYAESGRLEAPSAGTAPGRMGRGAPESVLFEEGLRETNHLYWPLVPWESAQWRAVLRAHAELYRADDPVTLVINPHHGRARSDEELASMGAEMESFLEGLGYDPREGADILLLDEAAASRGFEAIGGRCDSLVAAGREPRPAGSSLPVIMTTPE